MRAYDKSPPPIKLTDTHTALATVGRRNAGAIHAHLSAKVERKTEGYSRTQFLYGLPQISIRLVAGLRRRPRTTLGRSFLMRL